jgi:hypothetical protein
MPSGARLWFGCDVHLRWRKVSFQVARSTARSTEFCSDRCQRDIGFDPSPGFIGEADRFLAACFYVVSLDQS